MKDKHTSLIRFIQTRSGFPFSWGATDCCTLGADWVMAHTGIDPMSEYRGKYSSALGAARAMGGPRNIERAVANAMRMSGFEEIETAMMQRGDVCLLECGELYGIGICVGRNVAAQGKNGIEIVDTKTAVKAWRIS